MDERELELIATHSDTDAELAAPSGAGEASDTTCTSTTTF